MDVKIQCNKGSSLEGLSQALRLVCIYSYTAATDKEGSSTQAEAGYAGRIACWHIVICAMIFHETQQKHLQKVKRNGMAWNGKGVIIF